ncbi:acetyltransferase [Vibrio cholerae]|nr:acetyltransferase [Vibrio cholerae]MBJ6899766.1 acetyltransferase [Vibrio cholerae]
MVMVVVIEFGGMRCQPLRRALGLQGAKYQLRGRYYVR